MAGAAVREEAAAAKAEGRPAEHSWLTRGLAPEAVKEAEQSAMNLAANGAALELERINAVARIPVGTSQQDADEIQKRTAEALTTLAGREGMSEAQRQQLLIQIERTRGRVYREASANARAELNRRAAIDRQLIIDDQARHIERNALNDPAAFEEDAATLVEMAEKGNADEKLAARSGLLEVERRRGQALTSAARIGFENGEKPENVAKRVMEMGERLGMSPRQAETAYRDGLSKVGEEDGKAVAVPRDMVSASERADFVLDAAQKEADVRGLEGKDRRAYIISFTGQADRVNSGNAALIQAQDNIFADWRQEEAAMQAELGRPLVETDFDRLAARLTGMKLESYLDGITANKTTTMTSILADYKRDFDARRIDPRTVKPTLTDLRREFEKIRRGR